MNTRMLSVPLPLRMLLGTFLLVASAAALATDTAPRSADSERAACARHTSAEDRKTCLRETAAAKAEARRGELRVRGADYERNALQRCQALPAADQDACRARVRGEGTSSGSVEGGGIYRETREIVPAPTPPQ
jgi:hypothetical protein